MGITIQMCVRLVASVALLYFVWKETGWATVTFATLVLLESEVSAYAMQTLVKKLKTTG